MRPSRLRWGTSTGTLAGQSLSPGVYCVSSEAKTGVLTLSGGSNATWLIKVPSGALTGTNFFVVLAGGAQACNVTWWVDAAATMTTSAFRSEERRVGKECRAR